MRAKQWTAEIYLTETDDHTQARAVLNTGDRTAFQGQGAARRNPADPEVPEIGDELAVGRALVNLGNRLLRVADQEIADVTRPPQATGKAPGGWEVP